MSYWDSSALIKLYVKEVDSALLEQHAASASFAPTTSRLAFYEIRTVLLRKETEGAIVPGAAQSIYQRLIGDVATGSIRIVEFSDDVAIAFDDVLERCFTRSPPAFLRTLDGIHLAAAIISGESEFVATDKRLREAAIIVGLNVFP